MRKKSILSISSMEKFLKENGANRLSSDACIQMQTILENVASTLAKSAVKLAEHAGRKTILKEDIKLAGEQNGL